MLLYTKINRQNGNGYLPHRWAILLFTPPPGSRVRRLGWSQYMHVCVTVRVSYHGIYCAAQKWSCLRAATAGGVVGVFWYVWLFALTYQKTRTTPPAVTARRQDRLGCTIDPVIANPNTPIHVL